MKYKTIVIIGSGEYANSANQSFFMEESFVKSFIKEIYFTPKEQDDFYNSSDNEILVLKERFTTLIELHMKDVLAFYNKSHINIFLTDSNRMIFTTKDYHYIKRYKLYTHIKENIVGSCRRLSLNNQKILTFAMEIISDELMNKTSL